MLDLAPHDIGHAVGLVNQHDAGPRPSTVWRRDHPDETFAAAWAVGEGDVGEHGCDDTPAPIPFALSGR